MITLLKIFVASIFLTFLVSPAHAVDKKEVAERAAKWESYFYPGVEALDAKDYKKAEQLFLQAKKEIEPLGYGSGLASTLSNLGLVYESQGNYEKAKLYYNDAVGVSQRLRGNLHIEVAMDLYNLAKIENRLKNYDQAIKWITFAIEIMHKTGNGKKFSCKAMFEMYADSLEKSGDIERATKARVIIKDTAWEKNELLDTSK